LLDQARRERIDEDAVYNVTSEALFGRGADQDEEYRRILMLDFMAWDGATEGSMGRRRPWYQRPTPPPQPSPRRPPPLPDVPEETLREVWNYAPGGFDLFICPITHDVMREPVVAADGFTYERTAIEEWFRTSSKSPVSGEILTSRRVYTNQAIRTFLRMLTDLATEDARTQNKGDVSGSAEEAANSGGASSSQSLPERWPQISGVAKASFDGTAYGESYLVFSQGQRLKRVPHPEEGSGWAFGRMDSLPYTESCHLALVAPVYGWFPEEYLREDEPAATSDAAAASSAAPADRSAEPPPEGNVSLKVVKENFNGAEYYPEQCLTVERGESVEVLEIWGPWAWAVRDGGYGWVPTSFLDLASEEVN